MGAKILLFRDPAKAEPPKCSFCKKPVATGKALGSSYNDHNICFDCIAICNNIIAADHEKGGSENA